MALIEDSPRTLPMKAAGTQHLIERTYRESGTFQWVRETLKNALEAGAARIEYGIEWQAVETLGVYRRVIADNGSGMPFDELQEFFNTFGGGGKPIGGLHENFGVGAKTSLLPWNQYGLVVISWYEGDASMIWVHRDPVTGEYGLKLFKVEDEDTGLLSWEAVVEPFDDPEHGCDWSRVKPDCLMDHGTVIVLLGNAPTDNTVLGDPGRPEGDIKGISSYLNRRIWELPDDVRVAVDELRTQDTTKWPRDENEAHVQQPKAGYDRRTNLRSIEGARYFIEYPYGKGKLQDCGTKVLSDGTEVDWYLWEGERPAVQSYAAIGGYIAALYQNELYDVTSHHSSYRSFGISETSVRNRVWLIIRPPLADDGTGRRGVYPRTDRNSLLLKGGPNAGAPLPLNDWGGEFADNMPTAIREALRAQRAGAEGSIEDPAWRDRLAERFGARWRITKLRVTSGGGFTVTPTQPAGAPRTPLKKKKRARRKGGGNGGIGGGLAIGKQPGAVPAAKVKVGGGIPVFKAVKKDEVGPGILAAWMPHHPDHPEGAVLLNVEHPILEAQIEYWQSQYADHHAETIRHDVIQVYGEVAVAKIAHSEYLRPLLPSETIEKELRSEHALTMALLGLIAEEAVISTRIGGKYGKRKAIA
jgi:hypothetical protein